MRDALEPRVAHTGTQILAICPDYTRVSTDVSSLALLALISSRNRWLTPWLAAPGMVSLEYRAGYGLLAR